mmetsp:Transcript_42760/g.101496  ORF Transcript_42760/g.101496 Transcript_42760/m.101496 type:complete len:260 (+) Transcript_42760:795-1574(+)
MQRLDAYPARDIPDPGLLVVARRDANHAVLLQPGAAPERHAVDLPRVPQDVQERAVCEAPDAHCFVVAGGGQELDPSERAHVLVLRRQVREAGDLVVVARQRGKQLHAGRQPCPDLDIPLHGDRRDAQVLGPGHAWLHRLQNRHRGDDRDVAANLGNKLEQLLVTVEPPDPHVATRAAATGALEWRHQVLRPVRRAVAAVAGMAGYQALVCQAEASNRCQVWQAKPRLRAPPKVPFVATVLLPHVKYASHKTLLINLVR